MWRYQAAPHDFHAPFRNLPHVGVHPMPFQSWTRPRVLFLLFAAFILVAGTAAAWTLATVDHLASGSESYRFLVECDYDKFRQIMVRKNATDAIISQGGMSLIDEQVLDLQIDTSGDDRPLLHALRGRSKSEVEAVKALTVRLNVPAVTADELELVQVAEIDANQLNVETKSKGPAGNLENYVTSLGARPANGGTEVTLSVSMDVRVQVPKMFTSRADAEVQRAAEDAAAEQEKSIRTFIAEHADKQLILPEL